MKYLWFFKEHLRKEQLIQSWLQEEKHKKYIKKLNKQNVPNKVVKFMTECWEVLVSKVHI